MTLEEIKQALVASYAKNGGINHLDGTNLPDQESISRLAIELMHLLFPGFFEERGIHSSEVPELTARRLNSVYERLSEEIEKSLRFAGRNDPAEQAKQFSMQLLSELPALRELVHTDVTAAYHGDPAARSLDEIILAYPCVLVISIQRIAHVLYRMGVPLVPRMLTEYAHERTGTDIHPGARIGSHFFIDHCTGVVIGETATIGCHVKIYQGVTLGAKSFEVDDEGNPVKGVKRHPDVEDHVTIYAHATILGGDTRLGAHSIVGANVWLMHSIPANSLAYNKGSMLAVRPRKKKEEMIVCLNTDKIPAGGDWVI
jgi:serine O-acetyltransferase